MLNDPWIALFIFSQVSVVTVHHVCPPLSAQETLSSSVIETTAQSSLMNWEEHRLGTQRLECLTHPSLAMRLE